MKFMRNPIDGKVVQASPLMAKRLYGYQWEYVTRKEYLDYQRATLQASMVKHMPAAAKKLGRLH